ncbi:MAG TPA: hypothetical protein DCM86_06945 [Verrucomicrobiales bacterium]|mgnify:CR=1 FL=1|nr:hypothetical protein [Verrucomicrobiales bacterium]
MAEPARILYCHCAHAQVVPRDVKEAVLRRLSDSGVSFEAAADLCEMAARNDPALVRLAGEGCVQIAACYPRAVKWLFAAAGAPLDPARTQVLNMRTAPAEEIAAALASGTFTPNLPAGKPLPEDAPSPSKAAPAS